MDPISTIAMSIVFGAAVSAGNSAVSEVVKDAYKKLKSVMKRDYPEFDIAQLEEKKGTDIIKSEAEAYLLARGGDQSDDLLQAANNAIMAVMKYAPGIVSAVGVDLRDFTGVNLEIENIAASGGGVIIENGRLAGNINIKNVRAGLKPSDL